MHSYRSLVYCSLVCVEVAQCLAVISAALQKLHTRVTRKATQLRDVFTH